MEGPELHHLVAQLFARGTARTTRTGLEQELLVSDRTGRTVPVARLRAALRGTCVAPYATVEPGGQLELSLPPSPDAVAAVARLRTATAEAHSALARLGVDLRAAAVDPRPESAVPLRLRSERYLRMQRHFDTIGPAGRRMMRRTASTQVCLDWWPGRAGIEQWRALLLAGPFLAAASARDTGPGSRLATWLAVDPARTGFDDRLLHGDDPVAAYVGLAAGATPFLDGAAAHLSTLFPPVRPRGRYLEVRYLDAQVDAGAVAAAVSRIAYDDDLRREVLRRLEPLAGRLGELWVTAAAGELDHERLEVAA